MPIRVGTVMLLAAGLGCGVLLDGQVCRLSVAGLNQSRKVMGPVHAECPDEVIHTAPFGNWGVASNYGQKGNSHQFDGWCHNSTTCVVPAICELNCTDGWYEWNSCTDYAQFRPPNCTLYNATNCTEQVTTTGTNVHGTKYVDVPVRCPTTTTGTATQGGCADVHTYSSGTNYMSLYELDPGTTDDLVQTLYFPETKVGLTCDAWGCAPAGSPWVTPSAYDSPASPAKVYAELATVVNWGAFVDEQRVCNVPTTTVTYVSAASYFGPVLAPGCIASGFGLGLSPVTAAAQTIPLPTSLEGVSLVVTDSRQQTHNVPLFFISPDQVNLLVPESVASGTAGIAVYRGEVRMFSGNAQIETVAPALFSANWDGKGPPAAYVVTVTAGGSRTTKPAFACPSGPGSCVANPIDLGAADDQTFLELYGTGIRNNSGITSVAAKIGGVSARVYYAGAQGQYVGLDQINVDVPQQLRSRGQVDLVLTVASKPANTLTVFVQ
ncbi:MAG: hypothetical protein ABFD86_16815 [Bryobacteraceae bacterium]